MRYLLKPPATHSYSGPPVVIVDVRPMAEMLSSGHGPFLTNDLDEDGSVGGNPKVKLINVLLPTVLSGSWKGLEGSDPSSPSCDTTYIFSCAAGYRSNLAATYCKQRLGFKSVRNYGGGANEWWSAS